MRYLFLQIFIFTGTITLAQPSDFIILKKKDKTIRSYYAGTSIEFISTAGVYKNALIKKIENDTLYLQEFLVRQLTTQFGFYVIDTAGSYHYIYHYNQIKSIGKKQKGFDMRGSGAALFGGGTLLTLGSAVVYLADRDKFSPVLMGAGAALGLAGFFMSKGGNKGIVIGRKNYRLQYVKLTGN